MKDTVEDIPLAYKEGFVEFLESRIDLSYKPLIPRTETEWWVKKATVMIYHNIQAFSKDIKCLDIFAGSGCIGISMLRHLPISTVDFVDIEEGPLKQVEINCKLNGINESRYRIIKSDIFGNLDSKYDCIFANPPYVAKSRVGQVQDSVLKYEPHTALFGGEDGLDIMKRFLKEVKNYLNPGGELYLEFDDPQRDEIESILKQEGFSQYEFCKDQFKRWRYLHVQLKH